jgi:hypothetical protein
MKFSVSYHCLHLTSEHFPTLNHRIKSVLYAFKLTQTNNVPLFQRFSCFTLLQTDPNKQHRDSIIRWCQSYLSSISHPHTLSPYYYHHVVLAYSVWFSQLFLQYKSVCIPCLSTCAAHCNLLDFSTLTIPGNVRIYGNSMWNILICSFPSYLLPPNIYPVF